MKTSLLRLPKPLLDNLLSDYKVIIPDLSAGWLYSVTGSGVRSNTPMYMWVTTGATANSLALMYQNILPLNSGGINIWYADWTKDLDLYAVICRTGNDPECVARFQLKESNVEGALAQRGVGLEIRNFDMYGEGYGTSRGTVFLKTLPNGEWCGVRISKRGSRLDFYINGSLLGSLEGDSVPNVAGNAGFLVLSIKNGPTGGVDARLYISDLIIVQRW